MVPLGILPFDLSFSKISNACTISSLSSPQRIHEILSYLSNKISYDPDGVMVWNGKRCESTELSDEEREELENLLAPFKYENE